MRTIISTTIGVGLIYFPALALAECNKTSTKILGIISLLILVHCFYALLRKMFNEASKV